MTPDEVERAVEATRAELIAARRELDELRVELACREVVADDPSLVPWVVAELREAAAKKPVSVEDVTIAQLRALAAVYGLVSQWDVSLVPSRRLGDAMKVLPPGTVAAVEAILTGAAG
jgi:hypothetical protein